MASSKIYLSLREEKFWVTRRYFCSGSTQKVFCRTATELYIKQTFQMREIQNGKKVLGSLQYQPQVKILRERKEKKNPLMSYSLFSIHFLQSQSRVDNTSTSQKRFYRSRSRSRFTKSHVGARLKIEKFLAAAFCLSKSFRHYGCYYFSQPITLFFIFFIFFIS